MDKEMICFMDISQKILYDTSKAESELLSLINSTISHEMRNPLNSILNYCYIIKRLSVQFYEKILSFKDYMDAKIYSEIEFFYFEVIKGNEIQTSSSNLLLLNVEDILGYA